MMNKWSHILLVKTLHNKFIGGLIALGGNLFFPTLAFADGEEGKNYQTACVEGVITAQHDNAECWTCDVVFSLMQSLTGAAETLYGLIQSISLTILLYGGAIWIACYFLKALGSFASQDPAKILDGLIGFMFKWALAYVTVSFGLDTISLYIIDPLLDIGYSIGSVFSANAGIGGV